MTNFHLQGVVHLSISESVALQRLSSRRVDPVTGYYYYGNAPHPSIRARLVQADCDSTEHVSERYHYWYEKHKEILSVYKDCMAVVVLVIKIFVLLQY